MPQALPGPHPAAKLAWAGATISAALNFSTFLTWSPGPLFALVFPLHVGAIGLAFLAFWRSRHTPPLAYLRLNWAPKPALAALLAAFVYAGVNFTSAFAILEHSPHEETSAKQLVELRLFSGHWLFFYLLSATALQWQPSESPVGADALPRVAPAAVPTIRMWMRVLALIALFFGGAFAFVFDAALSERAGIPAPVWLFAWVALNGGIQYWWLRCPSCGRRAFRTPAGWNSPFVGSRCRWCGHDY